VMNSLCKAWLLSCERGQGQRRRQDRASVIAQ